MCGGGRTGFINVGRGVSVLVSGVSDNILIAAVFGDDLLHAARTSPILAPAAIHRSNASSKETSLSICKMSYSAIETFQTKIYEKQLLGRISD